VFRKSRGRTDSPRKTNNNNTTTTKKGIMNLRTYPCHPSNFTSNTCLDIDRNHLSTLQPTHINKFTTQIISLYLSDNCFTYIPPLISEKLPNLEKLLMAYNNISTAQFTPSMSNLTELNLSQNLLSIIPSSISNLTNLEYLDFHDNKITDITPSITIMKNLTNLEYLDFSRNMITEIPSSGMTELKSLIFLHLQNNLISRAPTLNFINHLNHTIEDPNDIEFVEDRFYGIVTRRSVVLIETLDIFMMNNPFINNYKPGDCLGRIFPSLKDIAARFVSCYICE